MEMVTAVEVGTQARLMRRIPQSGVEIDHTVEWRAVADPVVDLLARALAREGIRESRRGRIGAQPIDAGTVPSIQDHALEV